MRLQLWVLILLWYGLSFASFADTLSEYERTIYHNLFNAVAQNNEAQFSIESNKVERLAPTNIKNLINYYDERLNFTLLQRSLASKNLNLGIFSKLLQLGANPHEKLRKDVGHQLYKEYTSAHIAARRQKDVKVFDELFKYKVDFMCPDAADWRPLDIAFHENKAEIIHWFSKKFDISDAAIRKSTHRNRSFYEEVLGKAGIGLVYSEFDEDYFQLSRRGG